MNDLASVNAIRNKVQLHVFVKHHVKYTLNVNYRYALISFSCNLLVCGSQLGMYYTISIILHTRNY